MGTQRVQAFEILLSDFRRVLELGWVDLAGEVPPVAGPNGQLAVVFNGMYYPVRNVVVRFVSYVGLLGASVLRWECLRESGTQDGEFHPVSLEYREAGAAQRGDAT